MGILPRQPSLGAEKLRKFIFDRNFSQSNDEDGVVGYVNYSHVAVVWHILFDVILAGAHGDFNKYLHIKQCQTNNLQQLALWMDVG